MYPDCNLLCYKCEFHDCIEGCIKFVLEEALDRGPRKDKKKTVFKT